MANPSSIDQATLSQLLQNIQNYRPGESTPGAQIYGMDGISYIPGMTQGVYGGEGSTPTYTSDGKFYAGNYDTKTGGDLGVYDSTGKATGATQHFDPTSWDYDNLAMMAAGAFGVGFAAMAPGGFLSGATSTASSGSGVSGMDLASDGVGGNALPGYETGASSAGYVNGADLASDQATASGVSGAGNVNAGIPTGGGAPVGTDGTIPTTPGTTPSTPNIPKVPPIPGTGGGGTNGTASGGDLSGILGLLSGIYGANQQSGAAKDMLDYLKQRQDMNDKMYSTGSPEFNSLWDEMSRKDAAAGRNSQYGPRSVDLASRIAQLKMDNNTKMTTGIGNYMANALQQRANAGANITSMLPGLFGANGTGLNLSSLTNLINQQTGGGSNGTNIPGTYPNPSGGTYNPSTNPANPNLDSDPDANGTAYQWDAGIG